MCKLNVLIALVAVALVLAFADTAEARGGRRGGGFLSRFRGQCQQCNWKQAHGGWHNHGWVGGVPVRSGPSCCR